MLPGLLALASLSNFVEFIGHRHTSLPPAFSGTIGPVALLADL
jgi:hypothetical protein